MKRRIMNVVRTLIWFPKPATLAIMLMILSALSARGQEPTGFRQSDSVTYALYLDAHWEQLITEGEQALDKGYDYYYLRVRIGFAFYMLEKYRPAANHFEKAIAFNNTDTTILSYLHECYEWSGLEMEADFLEKRFPDLYPDRKKQNRFIRNLGIYSGYAFSGSEKKIAETDLDGAKNIYGEIVGNGDYLLTQTGITIAPAAWLRWYSSYTFQRLEKNGYYYALNNPLKEVSHYLYQHQYYTNFSLRLDQFWYLKPAFHLIHVSDMLIKPSYNQLNNDYSFTETDTSFNNMLFSVMLTREMTKFSGSLSLAGSNLNNREQYQASLVAGIFPQGNLNLYFFTTLSMLAESGTIGGHVKQQAGVRVKPWWWVEGSVHTGHLKNASDENGFLVYNVGGQVRTRALFSTIFLLAKNLRFQLDYSFSVVEETYIQYTDFSNFVTLPLRYANNSIMGGIKWKIK